MSSLRDTYYEYLSHISLTVMLDHAAKDRSEFVALSHLTDTLGDIAPSTSGIGLIPSEDLKIALDRLIAANILAPLDHPAYGPSYHITAETRAFHDAEHAIEGSTIWKCKTLKGYVQMVLQAMHEKKQAGFDDDPQMN